MAKVYEGQLSALGKSFAIVVSRFNEIITTRLLEGALDSLKRHGADEESIEIARVPGALEIPIVAQKLASSGKFDAIICLGAILRGQTPHFDYVAGESAKGIAQVGLKTGVPTIFGIVTADTVEQALDRAGLKAGNRGSDAAISAIEMADLMIQFDGKS